MKSVMLIVSLVFLGCADETQLESQTAEDTTSIKQISLEKLLKSKTEPEAARRLQNEVKTSDYKFVQAGMKNGNLAAIWFNFHAIQLGVRDPDKRNQSCTAMYYLDSKRVEIVECGS